MLAIFKLLCNLLVNASTGHTSLTQEGGEAGITIAAS